MKKVIVTGANGFVGSATVKVLLEEGMEVYAIDLRGHQNNLPEQKNLHFIPCDLDNIESLQTLIPSNAMLDTFYHFAWAGSAGSERANTKLQLQNAQWTIDALRTAKKLGCSRFICAGSIMEHETIAATYKQGNKPGLAYIYGGGKVIAHIMASSVAAEEKIDLIWAKITNAYGVGELSPRLVNTTIRKVIHGQPPQFTSGTQNYDFVYIDDVALAFYLIGKNGKPFHSYLIGSSDAKPLKEFLLEMKKSIAPDLDFIFGDIPFTGIDLPLSEFDCTETEKDTGFKAKVCFAEGTRRTMDWLKSQERK